MTSPPTSYTTSWDTTHATVARATVERFYRQARGVELRKNSPRNGRSVGSGPAPRRAAA